jgi:hypothetical protein
MHQIDTGDAVPVKQRPGRIPMHLREQAQKETEEMLMNKVIEPSNSPWVSPVVLVKKKDGTSRYCIVYREVNKKPKRMPCQSQMFNNQCPI